MRKRLLKKALSLLCSFILIYCSSIGVLAYETITENKQIPAEPKFIALNLAMADLNINSTGKAICTGHVLFDSGYSLDLELILQRDEGEWINKKTWEYSSSVGIYVEEEWYVTRGYDYRVEVKATLKTASGLEIESTTVHSEVISY